VRGNSHARFLEGESGSNTADLLDQLIENKQKFISQIMTGKSPVRSCEDIDESVLSYAEVKALATGNPYIKEKMSLDVEVAKLKMMKASYASQKYRMQDNISMHYPERIAALEAKVKKFSVDIQTYAQNRPADRDTFSMKVGNTLYHGRKEAGTALIEMCRHIGNMSEATVGEYQGFKMSASRGFYSLTCTIRMEGRTCHEAEASADPFGIIQRLDNVLEAMPKELDRFQRDLDNVRRQLETAKEQVGKPFEKEQELAEKSARLAELDALLNMDESAETVPEGGGAKPPDAEAQPEENAGMGPYRTDGQMEDGQMKPEKSPEGGIGNYGQDADMEGPSLSIAESGAYGGGGKTGEAETQHTEESPHIPPDSGKQGPDMHFQAVGQQDSFPDAAGRSVENPRAGIQNPPPQRAASRETSGCMGTRVSVREKLAAIRERRAREQSQAKKPEPGKRRDREAAL